MNRVRKTRNHHGVEMCRKWLEEEVLKSKAQGAPPAAFLSDKEIADEFGICRSAVGAIRASLGVPTYEERLRMTLRGEYASAPKPPRAAKNRKRRKPLLVWWFGIAAAAGVIVGFAISQLVK